MTNTTNTSTDNSLDNNPPTNNSTTAAKQHGARFVALVEDTRAKIQECSVDDVLTWQKNSESFHFIDVREDHEFNIDHATGAIHLGRGILERDIEEKIPNIDDKIVLYCGGGYRSALAAHHLQLMGYRNVWSMAGGIRAWRAQQASISTVK